MVWVKESLYAKGRGGRVAIQQDAYNNRLSDVGFFLRALEQFNKNYKGLFGENDEEDNEGGEESWFAKKWGWYITLDNISNSRVVDWDKLLDFKITVFLNMCAYHKDKQENERQHMERERIKWQQRNS
jgi:hypothetical protein